MRHAWLIISGQDAYFPFLLHHDCCRYGCNVVMLGPGHWSGWQDKIASSVTNNVHHCLVRPLSSPHRHCSHCSQVKHCSCYRILLLIAHHIYYIYYLLYLLNTIYCHTSTSPALHTPAQVCDVMHRFLFTNITNGGNCQKLSSLDRYLTNCDDIIRYLDILITSQ